MGEALEIVKALVSPVEKLLEIAKSGVGTLYEPRRIRKRAEAKVYEINEISEALRNNSDIILSYGDGTVLASTPELEEFAKRTKHRLAYQELRKQANIEAVVDNAYDELEQEREVSTDPVDTDWTLRFFNCVEDISNEKMQLLWGKLLAGETKQPGRFSLRTLETLKSLSQKEAQIFRVICAYTIIHENAFNLPTHGELFADTPIDYADIMTLGEAGLLNFQDVNYHFRISPLNCEAVTIGNVQITLNNASDRQITLNCDVYSLTTAGMELFDIVNNGEDEEKQDVDFINAYAVAWIVETLKDNGIEEGKYSISRDGRQFSIYIQ
ncbi:MAG: DUF2806 domain-containing protein [Clostridia bacterium]|nr:DUF2806 domain-containing protein [Clostridia bacterium]